MELKKSAIETVCHYSLFIGSKQHPVTISFYDGKFNGARYPFSGQYTREEWRALALIEEEIAYLERMYATEAGDGGQYHPCFTERNFDKIPTANPDMTTAEEDNIRMRDILWEIANSGVELDDERISYLRVQIDKELWKQILATAVGVK